MTDNKIIIIFYMKKYLYIYTAKVIKKIETTKFLVNFF